MAFRLFKRCLNTKNLTTIQAKGVNSNLTSVQQIGITNDKTTFVAYHPKPDFPYEFTRPIPPVEARCSNSLLKDTAINTAMEAFKAKHPEVARQELMNVTYTTKHRWYTRARDKKAKKTPMDREYL